jgi:hypothetical protein
VPFFSPYLYSACYVIFLSFTKLVWLLQWPGSFCDTTKGCCFPVTGEPGPYFGIHGLWPNRNDGSYPASCTNEEFDPSQVSISPSLLKTKTFGNILQRYFERGLATMIWSNLTQITELLHWCQCS